MVIQRDVKEAKNPRPSDPMKIHAGKSLLINFQLSKYSEVTSYTVIQGAIPKKRIYSEFHMKFTCFVKFRTDYYHVK